MTDLKTSDLITPQYCYITPTGKPSVNTWTTDTPTQSGVYIGYNGTPLVCVRLLGLDGQFIDSYLMQTGWGDLGAIENIAPKLWLRIDVERPTWIDEANANLAKVDLDKKR